MKRREHRSRPFGVVICSALYAADSIFLLTLGVLRPLPCLVTPVLLTLHFARIARQHTALAQHRPRSLVRSYQRARDSEAYGVGLRGDSAALDARQHIELSSGLGHFERLQDSHP